MVLLAACATQQEKKAALQQEADATKRECARLLSDAALNPIRSKVARRPLTGRPVTQPTNGYATPDDLPVIELWAKAKADCWAAGKAWRAKEPVIFTDVAEAAIVIEDGLIAELYLRKLSFRDFTLQRTGLIAAAQTALNQLGTCGTRFRQLQVRDQFVADCRAQYERDDMTAVIAKMRAQSRDLAKCHLTGAGACI
jgi:hypothetical protein